MRKRDFIVGAICAVGSFAAVLAISSPPALNATEPAFAAPAAIGTYDLLADGVSYTLKLRDLPDGSSPRVVPPEFEPKLTLVAKNQTDRAVSIEPTVRIFSQSLADRLSRVAPIPVEVWTWTPGQAITIAAGETRTFELDPAIKLQPSNMMSAAVHVGRAIGAHVQFSVGATDSQATASR